MLVRERWHLIWAPFRLACRSLCRAAHLVSFFYIPSRPASCLASRFASRLVRLALAYRLCVPSLRLVYAVSLLVLASCLGVSFCVSTSRLVLRPAFTACCGEAAFDAAPFRLACRLPSCLGVSSCVSFCVSPMRFCPCLSSCRFVSLHFCPACRYCVSSLRLVFLTHCVRFRSSPFFIRWRRFPCGAVSSCSLLIVCRCGVVPDELMSR